MSVQVRIILFKPSHTYFAGENISGQVTIFNHTRSNKRLAERLAIRFVGTATTNLRGKQVKNDQNSLVHTSRRNLIGQELYLNTQMYLTPEIDEETHSTIVQLAPGTNSFQFDFLLPSYLPSSFSSSLGAIKYSASTSVKIAPYIAFVPSLLFGDPDIDDEEVDRNYPPMMMIDSPSPSSSSSSSLNCGHDLQFNIINIQDLNLNLELTGHASYFSFEKLLLSTSSSGIIGGSLKLFRERSQFSQYYNGYVRVNVHLPTQGFILGDEINLRLSFNKFSSGQQLQFYVVELVREVKYNCPAGSLMETETIQTVTNEILQENEGMDCKLTIESDMLPTSSLEEALISIQYFVVIKLKLVSSKKLIVCGKVPIIIGTIPLRQIGWNSERTELAHGAGSTTTLREIENGADSYGGGAVGGAGGSHTPSAPLASADSVEGELWEEFPPSYTEVMGRESE